MLATIIMKDLKNILLSPKFVTTFIVCSILILLSIFVGIQEYKTAVRQYETGSQLADQDLRERTSWMGVSNRVLIKPDAMRIFVSGITNDIGRVSIINQQNSIKLENSNYSDDPVFAVFRMIDFAFIVQIVFSLLAILFTYNAINGERESGMLKLILSNSVPRYKYVTAKFIGSWLGLVIPLIIPILLSILLILTSGIPLSGKHWLQLSSILGISLLYFTFFIVLSLLVSTLTKKSASSFMVLLVIWITMVLVIPKAGTMMAGQLIHVPGIAEIESQKNGYAKVKWDKHDKALMERWRERNSQMEGMSKAERESYRDDNMWTWMEEDDQFRNETQQEVLGQSQIIDEDLQNRKREQEKLGLILARISPAASYQLAAMNLADVNLNLKNRMERELNNYRQEFTNYVTKKQAEDKENSGIQITLDSDTGFNINTPDMSNTIDAGSIPKFSSAKISFVENLNKAIPDFGLLSVYCLLTFLFSVLFFIKYDVR